MNNTRTVTYTTDAGVEFDIVRPDGSTEVKKHPTLRKITEDQFKQIQAFNAKQGKGEVVGYRNLTKTATKTIELDQADLDTIAEDRINNAMTVNGGSY